ncbi:XapX domain-containing protein [Paenibacillus sp. S-38]|uniref:XapX domain-containing protein n=1 Tax=Paenibacillus sp. S-38 TaxID=3416710 RepID=UPI003CEF4D79
MEAVLSLLAGIVVGVLFTFIRLPLPAPVTLAGVLGVAGVYLGGRLVAMFLKGS